MIIYCSDCGVEIAEGIHCNRCDPGHGSEPRSLTILVTDDLADCLTSDEPDEESQPPHKLTPRLLWLIITACAKATAAYFFGLYKGIQWMREVQVTPDDEDIIDLLYSYPLGAADINASIRGFITGFNWKLAQMEREAQERETWHHYTLWQRFDKGYFSTTCPLYLPCFIFGLVLSFVAMLTTRSIIVLIFVMALVAVTLLGINTLNFLACIREERTHARERSRQL